MIAEQSVLHTPTSALYVRSFADASDVVADVTGIPNSGSASLFQRARQFGVAMTNRSLGACQQALSAMWTSYMNAHIFTLEDGTRVWIDAELTLLLDDAPCVNPSEGSMSEYDGWLQAQTPGW
jgi:hypothetical protein